MVKPDLVDMINRADKDAGSKHPVKSATALKTISEAADLLDVPQHVLRFWETKFSQIKPLKRNGGRRFYRPEDIEVLLQIKNLLYKQGYTIKGARKAFEKKTIAQIREEFSDVGRGEPEGQDNDNVTESPASLENTQCAAIQAELGKCRDALKLRSTIPLEN